MSAYYQPLHKRNTFGFGAWCSRSKRWHDDAIEASDAVIRSVRVRRYRPFPWLKVFLTLSAFALASRDVDSTDDMLSARREDGAVCNNSPVASHGIPRAS